MEPDQDDLFQAWASFQSASGGEWQCQAGYTSKTGGQTLRTSSQGLKQEDEDFSRAKASETSGPRA